MRFVPPLIELDNFAALEAASEADESGVVELRSAGAGSLPKPLVQVVAVNESGDVFWLHTKSKQGVSPLRTSHWHPNGFAKK